jgi:hypothetical protein
VAAIGVIPTRIRSWHDFGRGGLLLLGVMVLYFLCFLAWFGSMGFFFRSIVKPEFRMGTQLFRFALVYPVVYVPVFVLLVIPDPGAPVWVILPLHIACMYCLFYLLYFVSKNLVLAETGKHVSFYEYAGHFSSCGFSLLEYGLSNRRSIGFTLREVAQKRLPRLARPSPEKRDFRQLAFCLAASICWH